MGRNKSSRDAIEKIDRLNKEAWELRVSDSNRSNDLSKEASDLAKSIDYTRGVAEGLRTLGFSLIRHSKHQEALGHLQQSLELFESLNDRQGQSDVLEYFGIIARTQGDYKASLESLFKSLEFRQETGYTEGMALTLYHLGVTYRYIGNLEQALEYFLQSLGIARDNGFWIPESYSLNNIGAIYLELAEYDNALEYFNQSFLIRKRLGDKWGEAGCLDNIGYTHLKNGALDEAINFCKDSLAISTAVGDKKGKGNALFHLAEINHLLGIEDKAYQYASEGLSIREEIGDKKGQAEIYLYLAEIQYSEKGNISPAEQINFLEKALGLGTQINASDILFKIHHAFYRIYKQMNKPSDALLHLELSNALEKEFHSHTLNQKILNLEISHQVENSRKEAEIYKLRNIELADLYEQSKKQKEEIQDTLTELKLTQTQLIQSEKMASLGELTAGIAHEIQNPLNFVNNFSELNSELIAEMNEELAKGNIEEAKKISGDIDKNEQKIIFHGKRADAIVKSMLQHSRASSSKKEPVDLNGLLDEYLRLAYHGLRAKDKSFNATLDTQYDETVGTVMVIRQDMGRVILNLLTNAFYSTTEKSKEAPHGFEPTVSVTTKRIADPGAEGHSKVEIKFRDNGGGIPKKVLDKIFQPFFTTKPTGEGTGLGLSLSYDIIKVHGGEFTVDTREGEFAEFTILLPL